MAEYSQSIKNKASEKWSTQAQEAEGGIMEQSQTNHSQEPDTDRMTSLGDATPLDSLTSTTACPERATRRDKFLLDAPSPSGARQRRKSPVTVQEWVASLPPPHVLQRQELDPEGCRGQGEREKFWRLAQAQPAADHSSQSQAKTPPSHVLGRALVGHDKVLKVVEDEDGMMLGEEAEGSLIPAASARAPPNTPNSQIIEGPGKKRQPTGDGIGHARARQQGEAAAAAASPLQDEKNRQEISNMLNEAQQKGQQHEQEAAQETPGMKQKISLDARRRLLFRTHDQPSFQSDISAKTASSVDSVLFSREVDPAELLMDLGFGGQSTDFLAKIPPRFFQKSHAKGISVEDFLKKQEEIIERFDSGFSGYRGLNAEMSRVHQAFKAAAHSVLSPANRQFIESQRAEAEKPAEDRTSCFDKLMYRTIILGGETFKINEDLNVIEEEDNEILNDIGEERKGKENEEAPLRDKMRNPFRDHPPPGALTKRDSSLSVMSSVSVDSDWSDDELEQLEKRLEDLQERSEAVEQSLMQEAESSAAHEAATQRWKQLRKQRAVVMRKLQMQQQQAEETKEHPRAGKTKAPSSHLKHEEDGERKRAEEEDKSGLLENRERDAQSELLAPAPSANQQGQQEQHAQPSGLVFGYPMAEGSLFNGMSAFEARAYLLTQGDHRIPRRFSAQRMRL